MKEFLKDIWKEFRSKPKLIILAISTSIVVLVMIVSAIIIVRLTPVWALYLSHREFLSRMDLLMEVMTVTVIQAIVVIIVVFTNKNKK